MLIGISIIVSSSCDCCVSCLPLADLPSRRSVSAVCRPRANSLRSLWSLRKVSHISSFWLGSPIILASRQRWSLGNLWEGALAGVSRESLTEYAG